MSAAGFSYHEALEELGYEGLDGCTFNALIELLASRCPSKREIYTSALYQQGCLNTLKNHPDVIFQNATTGVTLRASDIPEVDGRIKQESGQGEQAALLTNIRLRMSSAFICSLLNIWAYPDIIESESRLKVLLAIAKKRYEGYWQYALAKDLEMDPKTVFQNLKPLYRYELIARLSMVLPQCLKKSEGKSRKSTSSAGNLSSSGVLWFKRFFMLARLPKQLMQVYLTQKIDPFRNAVIDLLRQQPNNILLERDFRAYFISFFLSTEQQGTFLCSAKTVARFYLKIRRELTLQHILRRVRAWCPITGSLELCVMLLDPDEVHPWTNAKTNRRTAELNANDEEEDEDEDVEEEVEASVENVPSVKPIFSDNLPNTALPETPVDGDDQDIDVATEMNESNHWLKPMSLSVQIIELLKSVGKIGMVTPDLATILRTSTKRLCKPLALLEQTTLIARKPQRQGKYFMYRYFLAEHLTALGDVSSGSVRDSVDTMVEGAKRKSLVPASDGRAAARKTVTEQFCVRLALFQQWIKELGVTMIPELARRFAQVEKTPNGPDRKTIMRLATVALQNDDTLGQGKVGIGLKKSQELQFFFDKTKCLHEAEAAEIVKKSLSEKRSEACKEALKKNSELSRALKKKGDEESCKKAGAIDSLGRKLALWQVSENPVAKISAISSSRENCILSDIHVQPRLDEILAREAQHDPFSQPLLAHYGFVFPVMIRLKLFHSHLLSLVHASLSREEMGNGSCSFCARDVIDSMSVECFLRIVGYGYRDNFLEAYLHGSSSRCPDGDTVLVGYQPGQELKMKALPAKVYEKLVFMPKSPTRLRCHNRRTPTQAIHNLYAKLFKMNLVSHTTVSCARFDSASTQDKSGGSEDSGDEKLIESSVKTESGEVKNVTTRIRRQWSVKTTVEIYQFSDQLPGNTVVGTFDLVESQAFEKYWGCFKNQVDDWVRRYSREERTIVSQRGIQRSSRVITKYPSNMQLKEAFSKKNWKGQVILSTHMRQQLDNLADMIVRKSQQTNANNSGSLCVLNPQSPDIVATAASLEITADTVIRYLVRYFNTAGQAHLFQMVQGNVGNVAVHASRDLRYRCHICGAMYAQLPSAKSHYRTIHQQSLPTEEHQYLLPAEQERRKRRRDTEPIRRKRRRKMFTKEESTNGGFVSDRQTQFKQHVRNLLTAVSLSDSVPLAIEDAPTNRLGHRGEEGVPVVAFDWGHTWLDSTFRTSVNVDAIPEQEADTIAEWVFASSDEEDAVTKMKKIKSDEGKAFAQKYRLTNLERSRVRRFLQNARRDDEYALIAFLVVVERLKAAELHNPKPAATLSGAVQRDQLPPITDRLWELYSAFHPSKKFPPAATYFIVHYCLHRFSNSLNVRLLTTYRRLSGCDLLDALLSYSLPLRLAINDLHSLEWIAVKSPPDAFARDTGKVNPQLRLIMGRNLLKVVLLTQSSRYRPWWASQVTRELSDVEMLAIWHYWNRIGWVVAAKRSVFSLASAMQDLNASDITASPICHLFYWEALCKRRYALARSAQVLLLGRYKDWHFAHEQQSQVHRLVEVKNHVNASGGYDALSAGIPLQSQGLVSSSAATILEALATGNADIGVTWAQSSVGGPSTFPTRPDVWSGFCGASDGLDCNAPGLNEALYDTIYSALENPELESKLSPTLHYSEEPSTDAGTAHDVNSSADDDESDEDELESVLTNQEDEENGGDETEDYDRFFGASGVQEHICQLTKNVPDINSILWRPLPPSKNVLPPPATRLLHWDTSLSSSLCGVSESGDKMKPYLMDIATPDPWLVPATLDRASLFSDRDALDKHLYDEKQIEFREDVENGWSVGERNERRERETRVAQSNSKGGRSRRARTPPFTAADDSLVQDFMPSKGDSQVQNYYPGYVNHEDSERKSCCEAAYQPVFTIKGSGERSLDSAIFFKAAASLLPTSKKAKLMHAQSDAETSSSLVSALIWLHVQVQLGGESGVFQTDLLTTFCEEMKARYPDHDQVHSDFELALDILVGMRSVVRVAALADWRLLAPHAALPWTIHFRQLRKTEGLESLIEAVLAGHSTKQPTDDGVIEETLQDLQGVLTDAVVRPKWVPTDVWDEFGAIPGMVASKLGLYSSRTLSLKSRTAIGALLRSDARLLDELVTLQMTFADLRASCASSENMGEGEDYLFSSTSFLGVTRTPASVWVRLDGRLNCSLVAILCCRVYSALKESPGLTVGGLVKKIPLVDRCEMRSFCNAMVADGLLTRCESEVPQDVAESRSAQVPRSGAFLSDSVERCIDQLNPCSRKIETYHIAFGACYHQK